MKLRTDVKAGKRFSCDNAQNNYDFLIDIGSYDGAASTKADAALAGCDTSTWQTLPSY